MADIIVTGTSGYATGSIDTASTVVNNVTATDAAQPNGLAAAVVQIETILGVGTTLRGSTADLATRLAVGTGADGLLKLSTDASITGPLSVAKGGTGGTVGGTVGLVPPGAITAWSTTTAPTGYVLCDGTAYSRTITYNTLYAVIGTTYGVGDGATTFNVPDLRGRAIIMVDGAANRITAASTNGGNADTIGGVGGTETHTLITAESPSHTHTLTDLIATGTGGSTSGIVTQTAGTGTQSPVTDSTGGGGAHSNTQPWIALEYIIKY